MKLKLEIIPDQFKEVESGRQAQKKERCICEAEVTRKNVFVFLKLEVENNLEECNGA
jgi:hypothetical protein